MFEAPARADTDHPSSAFAAADRVVRTAKAGRRAAGVMRWRAGGMFLYLYVAIFAFGTLGTLASSGVGPAALMAGVTWLIYKAAQRSMRKADEAAAQ